MSGVVETGRQGIKGKLGQMFTGVQRYIVNNTTDIEKQQSIKYFLNTHTDQHPYGVKLLLSQMIRNQMPKFQDKRQIKLGILTWNLAGNAPPNKFDLSQIILPQSLDMKADKQ